MLLAYGVIWMCQFIRVCMFCSAYIMLQPLNNNTNSVEQRHLGFGKLNLLHQRHQSVQHDRRVR